MKFKNLKQIDEYYDSQFKLEEKNLSEKLKLADRPLKVIIEKEYHVRLNELIQKYKKDIENFVKKNQQKVFEEDTKIEQKKVIKKGKDQFEVEHLDLALSKKQQFFINWQLFKFKFRLKLKNFFDLFIPVILKKIYYKLKLFLKIFYLDTKSFFGMFFYRINLEILTFFNKSKNKVSLIYTQIKDWFSNLFKKIWAKFKKKEDSAENLEKEENKELSVDDNEKKIENSNKS